MICTTVSRFAVWRRPRWLILGGMLLLALALTWKGVRLARVLASLQARQTEATELLAQGPAGLEAADVEHLAQGIRSDVLILDNELRPLLPLTALFGWLPRVGPLMSAAPELLELADAGTLAGVHGAAVLSPAVDLLNQDTGPIIPQLVTQLAGHEANLAQMELALARADAARKAVGDPERLPWRIRQALAQLDEWLPLAEDMAGLLQVVPAVMGHDGPRTYLILAMNEDELRPAGGLISGAGLLRVADGAIVDLSFSDANLVDDYLNKPYADPPAPLTDFMGLELFFFRDAGYWPDFPTTAEQAMGLYTYGQGVDLDGAVAIDQRFVELILRATGPVEVPELAITVTADNVVQNMRAAWGIDPDQPVGDWILSRKNFMGPLAAAVLQRIETAPGTLDPIRLSQAVAAAVNGKHLRLYMRDPGAAAMLARAGWDGRLPTEAGQDIVLVAETNVGYSKINALIERELDYRLQLHADGSGTADLSVTYQHGGVATGAPCVQTKIYSDGQQYESLLDDCYWNYVRLYAPTESRLLDASSHPAPGSAFYTERPWRGRAEQITDPTGLSVFANFLLLPRAASDTVRFVYELPAGTARALPNDQWQYRLRLLKHPGLGPTPFALTLTLPDGAFFLGHPEGAQIDGPRLSLAGAVDGDLIIDVAYRLRG